jgi:hypothetical protein
MKKQQYVCPKCGCKMISSKHDKPRCPLDKSNMISHFNMHMPIKQCGNYRIFTKDEYKRYRLSGLEACNITKSFIERLDEQWNHMSKGFKFVIGVGIEGSLMFFDVEYFNKDVLG